MKWSDRSSARTINGSPGVTRKAVEASDGNAIAGATAVPCVDLGHEVRAEDIQLDQTADSIPTPCAEPAPKRDEDDGVDGEPTVDDITAGLL